MLAALASYEAPAKWPTGRRGTAKTAPRFEERVYLVQLRGVDLNRIVGIEVRGGARRHPYRLDKFRNTS